MPVIKPEVPVFVHYRWGGPCVCVIIEGRTSVCDDIIFSGRHLYDDINSGSGAVGTVL